MADKLKAQDIEEARKKEFQEKLRSLTLLNKKSSHKNTTDVTDTATVQVRETDETMDVKVLPNPIIRKLTEDK